MDALRRSTLITVAACAAVAAGLWLAFWILLEPVESASCNTTLLDGAYEDALVPAHLAGAALLSWAVWEMARTTGVGLRGTRIALIAIWVVIGLSFAEPGVFGLLALVLSGVGIVVGLPALAALGIGVLVNLRRPNRWESYAAMARVLAWGCLVVGLPSSIAFAYGEGASLFCF